MRRSKACKEVLGAGVIRRKRRTPCRKGRQKSNFLSDKEKAEFGYGAHCKTPSEKLRNKLHGSDGRKLGKHTIFHIANEIVNGDITKMMASATRCGWYVNMASLTKHYREETKISVTVTDWMVTIMDILEFNAMLREANEETDKSLAGINNAYNKVHAVYKALAPTLEDMTKKVVQSRMTIEREMKQSFDAFKAVRDFFLEKSYENEMTRMKEFISVCKQLQQLKESGVLDVVSDLAIKLAIGKEKS